MSNLDKSKFGHLTVVNEFMIFNGKRNIKYYECKCDCGKIVNKRADVIKNSKLKSCGCSKNFVGMRFNKWVVLEDKGVIFFSGMNQKVFRCKCDCGRTKDVQASNVKSGKSKSCGCELNIKEIINKKFNRLTVIEDNGVCKKRGKRFLKCRCDCGNIVNVNAYQVISGHTKSCGCIKHNKPFKERNMIGKKFSKLTVVKENGFIRRGRLKKRRKLWLCKCDCGKEVSITEHAIINGNTKSCGCIQSESQIAAKFNDLTGKRFGRLTVIGFKKRVPKNILWECKCDCGEVRNVRGSCLITGNSKSCGCLLKERITKHGLCKKGTPARIYTNYRRQDPVKRFRHQVSGFIRKTIKKKGGIKDGKIFDYLPYTLKELKEHVESLWEPWMNWDNYGGYNGDPRKTWQLDHIKPQSKFNFKSMKDSEFLECWSLKNLQPLEKKANMRKGNR